MGKRLKDALAQGKLVHVFGIGQLCHPKIVEIIGLHGGYDAVWLDQEHAGLSIAQIEHACLAAHPWDRLLRSARSHRLRHRHASRSKRSGIMAAQVKSAAEAEQVVYWAKFHPRGLRGVNGSGIDGRFATMPMPEYMQRCPNAESFIAIQIEHYGAVDDVEKIAAIKDVDVLFIGPADLGQSMGLLGDWTIRRSWQAIELIAKAAQANGIHWAILPRTAAYARPCVDLGLPECCRSGSVRLGGAARDDRGSICLGFTR